MISYAQVAFTQKTSMYLLFYLIFNYFSLTKEADPKSLIHNQEYSFSKNIKVDWKVYNLSIFSMETVLFNGK